MDLLGMFLGRLPLLTLLSWEAFRDAPLTEAAASLIAPAASPLLAPLVVLSWRAFRLFDVDRVPAFYARVFPLDYDGIVTGFTFSSSSLPESMLMFLALAASSFPTLAFYSIVFGA